MLDPAQEALPHLWKSNKDTLRKFRYRGATLSNEVLAELGQCRLLEFLELSFKRCHSRDDDTSLEAIGQLPLLRYLALGQHSYLTAPDFARAFSGKRLENLAVLKLRGFLSLGDADLRVVAEACPGLTGLTVADCPRLTDGGIRRGLRGCPKLRRLGLYWMEALTTGALADLTILPELEQLKLFGSHGLLDYDFLLEILSGSPNLKLTCPRGLLILPSQ
jgi:hypothetical protein